MTNLKDSYINFWTDKIHDDSKSLPNGNKLRTYRTFKSLYERETYLFVNELPKMEISTFAKLRISAHDLHIEKGRHTKIKLSNRKCFLCGIDVEDELHFVMNCSSLSTYTCRNTFSEELVKIVPSFLVRILMRNLLLSWNVQTMTLLIYAYQIFIKCLEPEIH